MEPVGKLFNVYIFRIVKLNTTKRRITLQNIFTDDFCELNSIELGQVNLHVVKEAGYDHVMIDAKGKISFIEGLAMKRVLPWNAFNEDTMPLKGYDFEVDLGNGVVMPDCYLCNHTPECKEVRSSLGAFTSKPLLWRYYYPLQKSTPNNPTTTSEKFGELFQLFS